MIEYAATGNPNLAEDVHVVTDIDLRVPGDIGH